LNAKKLEQSLQTKLDSKKKNSSKETLKNSMKIKLARAQPFKKN